VTAVAALILSGCAGSSGRAARIALAALHAAAPPVTSAGTPPAPNVSCKDVTASLRPPARMPAPGHMPAGSFMAKIRRQGRLIAGVDQNTLLFAYFNPLDGQIEGLEIDLLRQVAEAIFGNPNAIEFKALSTAERLPAVAGGSVDIVADAITVTCARRQQVDFSNVYYNAGQRLLVPTNSPIHSLQDLGGKRVCATIGSTSIQTLESLNPRAIPYPVPQRTDCLVALQEGKVDAVTSDDTILLGFIAQDPYTKMIGPSFAPEPYAMAISKAHPDFVAFVNGVLAHLRADGELERIYQRWLGRYETVPQPPAPQYENP